MAEDRLITIAIHTYDRAVALKALLEREGVTAVLHNVNLSSPVVSSGIRVRIRENDLPMALRIIESIIPDPRACVSAEASPADKPVVILPIDFADYSTRAADIAFDFGRRLGARILLLHTFINPAVSKRVQLSDQLTFEIKESQEVERRLRAAADRKIAEVTAELRSRITRGDLPQVPFSADVREGVPEDVINELAKELDPALIVMGTRSIDRKNRELIGSVSAEVLDSCRYPIFTIPENADVEPLSAITEVMFFSNLEQEDLLGMESLYRLFNGIPLKVTIVHVPGRKEKGHPASEALKSLVEYCRSHYPKFTFSVETLRPGNLVEDYRRVAAAHTLNLVVLPNKRRNVFARFFNPSLAHKLLLNADIPLLAIPV